MGTPVLIIGKSGSGKSCSLRNFPECGIINVMGKPMPFRGSVKQIATRDYSAIMAFLHKAKCSSIAIDDAGYLITSMFMDGHGKTGKGNDIFSLYNNIGDSFYRLVTFVINDLPAEKIVYFMMHEDKNDFGDVKPKTIGKLLDEKVCVEGMFTICIRCQRHRFITQAMEGDVAKSPMDMFDTIEIDNDLAMVDATIREYYELPALVRPEKPKEETE